MPPRCHTFYLDKTRPVPTGFFSTPQPTFRCACDRPVVFATLERKSRLHMLFLIPIIHQPPRRVCPLFVLPAVVAVPSIRFSFRSTNRFPPRLTSRQLPHQPFNYGKGRQCKPIARMHFQRHRYGGADCACNHVATDAFMAHSEFMRCPFCKLLVDSLMCGWLPSFVFTQYMRHRE